MASMTRPGWRKLGWGARPDALFAAARLDWWVWLFHGMRPGPGAARGVAREGFAL